MKVYLKGTRTAPLCAYARILVACMYGSTAEWRFKIVSSTQLFAIDIVNVVYSGALKLKLAWQLGAFFSKVSNARAHCFFRH